MTSRSGSSFVFLADELIDAEYQVSDWANRILQTMFCMTNPFVPGELPEMKIMLSDFTGNPNGTTKGKIEGACEELIRLTVHMKDPIIPLEDAEGYKRVKGWRKIPLVTLCEFHQGSGYLLTRWHPMISPYLNQLKDYQLTYSKAYRAEIDQIKTDRYLSRLYWRARKMQHKRIPVWKRTLKEFRDYLGVPPDQYTNRHNHMLIDRTLGKAQKKFETFENLRITYQVDWNEQTVEMKALPLGSLKSKNLPGGLAEQPAGTPYWVVELIRMGIDPDEVTEIQTMVTSREVKRGGVITEAYVGYCIEHTRRMERDGQIQTSVANVLRAAIVYGRLMEDHLKAEKNRHRDVKTAREKHQVEINNLAQYESDLQALLIFKNMTREYFESLKMKERGELWIEFENARGGDRPPAPSVQRPAPVSTRMDARQEALDIQYAAFASISLEHYQKLAAKDKAAIQRKYVLQGSQLPLQV